MGHSLGREFAKYSSANILGMVGISLYILADTFFIAQTTGPLGLTALNLSIPAYSVMHGLGLMIGIGGATRFSIAQSQADERTASRAFVLSIKAGLALAIVLLWLSIVGAETLAKLLGADGETLSNTRTYVGTLLLFAPLFVLNNILLAFLRNDRQPRLAMMSMLAGSLSNIVLDYIFMYPLGLGIFGAALATGIAPLIGISIALGHFLKQKKLMAYLPKPSEWSGLPDLLSLGSSALVIELSSGVVLFTFNWVILGLEGNEGVAAFGIIANLAIVGIAIFTGLAQGTQPLASKYYGLNKPDPLKKVTKFALLTTLAIALLIYLTMFLLDDQVIRLFNKEGNVHIAAMAKEGLHIYFLGLFFAGVNIVATLLLSATENARDAFVISITRGFVIIVPFVLVFSRLWQMTGVWLAFVLTELVVTLIALRLAGKRAKVKTDQKPAVRDNWI